MQCSRLKVVFQLIHFQQIEKQYSREIQKENKTAHYKIFNDIRKFHNKIPQCYKHKF